MGRKLSERVSRGVSCDPVTGMCSGEAERDVVETFYWYYSLTAYTGVASGPCLPVFLVETSSLPQRYIPCM